MNPGSLFFSILAVVFAMPVNAQNALEEVVVTAQRREQGLQEVPVSVTAFTGASLEQNKIKDAADYLALTPNVGYTDGFSVGKRGIGIGIRGVNNMVTDENSFINSVGVYIDGFSVAAVPTGIANPQLQDVARIEVLRGPQGTYFGRNAVGGALNLTTEKPNFEKFEGKIIADFESPEGNGADPKYGVTTIVNVPISDTLAARGVFYYEDDGGLVTNRWHEVDPTVAKDSSSEYIVGRINLSWKPSDATSVDLLLMHTDEDQGTDETVSAGVWDIDTIDSFGFGAANVLDVATVNAIAAGGGLPPAAVFLSADQLGAAEPADTCANHPGGFVGDFQDGNLDEVCRDEAERNDNNTTLIIANVSHDLTDDISLKGIAGVITTENFRSFDNDLVGGADVVFRNNDQQGTSWSLEGRMEMTKENFDFILGVMYAEDKIDRQNGTQLGLSFPDTWFIDAAQTITAQAVPEVARGASGACVGCSKKTFDTESVAVFADSTWHFTEKLDLTFGFRFTHDEITNGLFNARTGGPGGTVKAEFDDLSPRIVARYQINDDVSIYGSISKGYKAGGNSTFVDNSATTIAAAGSPQFTAQPFSDETLWTYEIGTKSEWFDNRLRINAAAFYTKWNDLQIESFRFLVPGDLSSNIEQTISVDTAEAIGLEIELAAVLTDSFTVTGSLGLLGTEITCTCPAVIKGSVPVILGGTELPRAPKITGNITGEYRAPFGENEVWGRVEYIHRGSQTTDVEGSTIHQTGQGTTVTAGGGIIPAVINGFPYESPDYDLVNLRAGFIWNDNIEISAYVKNVFEERYWTGTQEDFGLSGFRLRPHPRTFGVGASYSF